MPQAAAEKRIARALSLAIQKPTIASGPAAPFLELHTVLRELFPLLFTQGDWETVEERALLGRVPGSGGAQRYLVTFLARLESRWHTSCDVEHAQIAIRHADVETRAAGDLRRVEQDASLEIAT